MSAVAALPERFGRYRVLRELGRGAMGVVYLAEDSALGRTVAIKTVALTGDEEERDLHEARFRQEARAAGGVSHPAIITIYDVGREGDQAFIAMEVLQGRELRDLIRHGDLTPSRAVEIAAQVAEGLAFAHERGVVHRDIKPGNIMVLDDGRVKLMDFGIARLQEPSVRTQTGVLLGSPQYMSPEQVSGRGLDGRADVFSLGVVLYEMVTGVKPFDAADLTQVLFWVVNMPARPPSERRPGLPVVLDYIVARALKKNPEERYTSGHEFAADLRACLAEVRAAEAAMGPTPGIGVEPATQPELAPTERIDTRTVPMPPPEERIALRPAPRFDCVEGMARLAVLPERAQGTQSREGWTVLMARPRKALDRSLVLLWLAYGLAAIAAMAIVFL